MMRVEVNMDEPLRGIIAKYAKDNGVSMPTAYSELMQKGILVSELELNGIELDVSEEDFDTHEIVENFDGLELSEP